MHSHNVQGRVNLFLADGQRTGVQPEQTRGQMFGDDEVRK